MSTPIQAIRNTATLYYEVILSGITDNFALHIEPSRKTIVYVLQNSVTSVDGSNYNSVQWAVTDRFENESIIDVQYGILLSTAIKVQSAEPFTVQVVGAGFTPTQIFPPSQP